MKLNVLSDLHLSFGPPEAPDNDADVFVGWSGRQTIVTVEQLVSDEAIRDHPDRTILPRDAVTCVVEAPYGAYPCACDDRYTYDLDWVAEYYAASADPAAFAGHLDAWVFGLAETQMEGAPIRLYAAHVEQVTQSEVIKFSAGGFRDFTRIASSDPVMWRDVFLNNKEAVLEMLGRFSEDLAALQRMIRWDDGAALEALFTRTRAIRRGIIEAGQDTEAADFGRPHGHDD